MLKLNQRLVILNNSCPTKSAVGVWLIKLLFSQQKFLKAKRIKKQNKIINILFSLKFSMCQNIGLKTKINSQYITQTPFQYRTHTLLSLLCLLAVKFSVISFSKNKQVVYFVVFFFLFCAALNRSNRV